MLLREVELYAHHLLAVPHILSNVILLDLPQPVLQLRLAYEKTGP